MTSTHRWLTALLVAAWPTLGLAQQQRPAPYLYVWAGDADTVDSDFLAVIDVRPGSPTYARVVATVPAFARGTRPHHTEHQLESDPCARGAGAHPGRGSSALSW